MKRIAAIAALALVTFIGGIAAAKAAFGWERIAFGWERIAAPCAPTGVALNAQEIAVICPNDRTVYLRLR